MNIFVCPLYISLYVALISTRKDILLHYTKINFSTALPQKSFLNFSHIISLLFPQIDIYNSTVLSLYPCKDIYCSSPLFWYLGYLFKLIKFRLFKNYLAQCTLLPFSKSYSIKYIFLPGNNKFGRKLCKNTFCFLTCPEQMLS